MFRRSRVYKERIIQVRQVWFGYRKLCNSSLYYYYRCIHSVCTLAIAIMQIGFFKLMIVATLYVVQGCVKPSMKVFKYKPKPFVSVISSF